MASGLGTGHNIKSSGIDDDDWDWDAPDDKPKVGNSFAPSTMAPVA